MKTCTLEGCPNRHVARGLCSTHYNQQHQPDRHRKVVVPCAFCEKPCEKEPTRANRYVDLFCSLECRDLRRIEQIPAKPISAPLDLRSPLRRAIEGGDHASVIAAIRSDCELRPSGCWEWQRKFGKDCYPVVSVGGRTCSVHRIALEAKLGAKLGTQAAHHKCANTFCVNPDHLEPVTAAANTAEMLARTYLVRRIQELESALRDLAPGHPALHEVGIRQIAA